MPLTVCGLGTIGKDVVFTVTGFKGLEPRGF